jgi:hypothetical protein
MPMADVIQLRRDTASNWTSANPTLASGELGMETDTGKLKLGTGALAWNSLSYYTAAFSFAPLASPTFTGTATAPTVNASTALQIGGAAVTSTPAELNILDGVTSTTAELNILDGVTSTPAELNILDGVTATTAELNYVDGVTSAIQTQIDTKGTVSNLSDLSITSTAAELNALDGIPAGLTATELGYVDGVTSAIQTQIDTKGTVSDLSDLSITSTAAELNKLDALSRGSIIYGNASGATTVLTKGTSAQVLTSDGTDIAWAAAGGGGGGGSGWTYISTITASGASTVEFTSDFTSTYDDYMVVGGQIIGSSGGTALLCQTRANGSWLTSTTYYWHCMAKRTSGNTYGTAQYGTTTSYQLTPTSSLATGVNDCVDITVYLPTCYSSGMRSINAKVDICRNSGKGGGMNGFINNTSIVNGVRFFASSGNLSGTFKFYGLTKS